MTNVCRTLNVAFLSQTYANAYEYLKMFSLKKSALPLMELSKATRRCTNKMQDVSQRHLVRCLAEGLPTNVLHGLHHQGAKLLTKKLWGRACVYVLCMDRGALTVRGMACLRTKGALKGILPAQFYLTRARKWLTSRAASVQPVYAASVEKQKQGKGGVPRSPKGYNISLVRLIQLITPYYVTEFPEVYDKGVHVEIYMEFKISHDGRCFGR